MNLDRHACYRALRERDPRFDGRLFVGVRTTGIYCRPICPARTPKLENVAFFPSTAAAEHAGFRACLRCRPESSPDLAVWGDTSNAVTRALAMIADGALGGPEADVERLALRLGFGEAQLRSMFQEHLGASPTAVALTRRALFAKQLLHETDLCMADVALAAGLGSVRRFGDTFRRLHRRAPNAFRRPRAPGRARDAITLFLSYAPPYDWQSIIAFLAARAIPGVEVVEPSRYRRTIEIDGHHGTIEVTPAAGRNALAVTLRFGHLKALPRIVARIRRVFDLGADVLAIGTKLAEDPCLAPLVATRPGLRVPGAWDGFELGVRAVLGQQITVAGARRLAGELVAVYGEPLADSGDAAAGVTTVFPRPEHLAGADLTHLGMPHARAAALAGLAKAAAADAELFHPREDLDAAVARLRELPGIGEWTAQYIALRALREPDAFPAADIGLLRAVTGIDGVRPTPERLRARAEAWRPWRAYAAQHLWTAERPVGEPVRPARPAVA